MPTIKDLLKIENPNVKTDETLQGDINLTGVDAIRIAYDLAGRGVLNEDQIAFVKQSTGIVNNVKPILHPNQYFHLLEWLKRNHIASEQEYRKTKEIMTEEPFTGI